MGDILKIPRWGGKANQLKDLTMEELWKPWIESSEYLVSNQGSIKKAKTGQILKKAIDRYGYFKLSLTIAGKKLYRTVHRMVAMTWIENPENKPQVNHKNGVKQDNSVDNLEWSTESENISHSFELGLNDNRFAATMEDLETGVIVKYRSLKTIARLLETYVSVLIPMMRWSVDYPILDRYVIRIEEEEILKRSSNTVNSGIPIYVFDWCTGVTTMYESSLIAAYFTGIRCLSTGSWSDKVLENMGYSVCRNPELLPKSPVLPDRETVLAARRLGLSQGWAKRDHRYVLFNYFTKDELLFDTITEIMDFLDCAEPFHVKVTYSSVTSAIGKGKNNNNGLVKGYGINTDKRERVWFEYAEEVIHSSAHGCLAPTAVYKLNEENRETLVFGKHNLCRALGFRIDGSETHPVLNRLIDSYSAPNVSIVRLNSPIL